MTELRPSRRKNEPPYYLSNEGKRYYDPNHAQLTSAVKGGDRNHRIRPRRSPIQLARYAMLVLALLIGSFAALFVIAEVIVK